MLVPSQLRPRLETRELSTPLGPRGSDQSILALIIGVMDSHPISATSIICDGFDVSAAISSPPLRNAAVFGFQVLFTELHALASVDSRDMQRVEKERASLYISRGESAVDLQ